MAVFEGDELADVFEPKATAAQEREVRRRALDGGVSFSPLRSAGHASEEIDRLAGVARDSVKDRRREAREIADEIAAGPRLATDFSDDEIDGVGSGACWS